MRLDVAKVLANPQPIPTPRIISPFSNRVEQIVRAETLKSDAEMVEVEKTIAQPQPVTIQKQSTLSRLIDDDFPFDESQLAAINGMVEQKHACLTGAAGTGKTTVTKAFTDRLIHDLPSIDMSTYFKSDETGDPDDEYESPESLIPAIALIAFTGRATQMIKKNFPMDWHGNIMTIHRLLGFYPEYYEDIDSESGEVVKKRRFVPLYTRFNKLPWKVIIIDEAGMTGLDLWHQLLDACTEDTRIYFIGDINQLPPTHGKSIFGFAMSKWPTWQLTKIHRQKGDNNTIVDNAWRIINGEYPQTDQLNDPSWRFVMQEIPADPNMASRVLRKWLTIVKDSGVYDPIRDTVITPINAYEDTAAGFALGQDPLNRDLALVFNSSTDRYVIDAGRERKYFAVGDKVMATKNDHSSGITNGMTGIITAITMNGDYTGNAARYGLISDVNKYIEGDEPEDIAEFSLEDLAKMVDDESQTKKKEERDRGPARLS